VFSGPSKAEIADYLVENLFPSLNTEVPVSKMMPG